MGRLQLSKSSLAREINSLGTYERFLPSLDLKRKQLMMERAKADQILNKTRKEIDNFKIEIGQKLPMLANEDIELTDLSKITDVDLETENIAGTRLPKLKHLEIEVHHYALLAKPHWVDAVAEMLHDMLKMCIQEQIMQQRLALLTAALNTITQRVNLFDKVLIPKTITNIKQIKIYLSDEEMAAVVRSKIAKRKRSQVELL